MKSFKSKKTIASSVALLVGFLFAFSPVLVPTLLVKGWDLWPAYLPLLSSVGIGFILTVLLYLIFREPVMKYCSLSTTLCSLGISASGILFLYCTFIWAGIFLFEDIRRYPITYPCSIGFGIFALISYAFFIVFYVLFRKNSWSVKGVFLDFAISLFSTPAFLLLYLFLEGTLSALHASEIFKG